MKSKNLIGIAAVFLLICLSAFAIFFDVSSVELAAETEIITEEDALKNYPYDYAKLTASLNKRYSDFKANQKYHKLRKNQKFENDPRITKVGKILRKTQGWPIPPYNF